MFPCPVTVPFSSGDYLFPYTHSWNLCMSDSTFLFQGWPCDLVLASKSTTSFWPQEFRSRHVTQAELIRSWGLHWTSVLRLSDILGVRQSLYRVGWSCWWLSCHHMGNLLRMVPTNRKTRLRDEENSWWPVWRSWIQLCLKSDTPIDFKVI